MATQLFSGGGRRSAAPTINYTPVQRSGVMEDDFLNKLTQQLQSAFSAPASAAATAVTPVSEALSRGSYVADANFNPNAPSMDPQQLRAALSGLSALGAIMKAPELSQAAGVAQTGYNLATANSPTQAAMAVLPMAAQAAGIPGGVVGLGASALQGNTAGMIDSAIGLANPATGAANAVLRSLTSLFGDRGVSIGNIATQAGFGQDVFGNVGPIDATQGAMELNTPMQGADRLGALIALSSDPGSSTQLNTGAATTAANALSMANNVDSLDALMTLTSAFGTADTASTAGTATGSQPQQSSGSTSSSYSPSSSSYNSSGYYSSNGGTWSSVW